MSLRRKIILSLLAVLLLLPTATVYYIASTEAGLRLLASRLGKVGPVTLTVGAVEGSLTGGFTIESLRVQHRRSDVLARDISGRLELLPLLVLQRITLSRFHAADVNVQVLSSDERSEREPRFLPRMLRLDADQAQIDNVDLILISGRRLNGTNLSGAVTILPSQIRVRTAQVDTYDARLVATGRVLAARPVGLRGDVDIDWRPEGRPAWQAHTSFEGDLDSLPLEAQIAAPFHAVVDGEATTLNAGWQFQGKADVTDLDIEVFGGGGALGIISAQLDIGANADGFTATGRATPPGLKAGAFDVDFDGFYSSRRLTIRDASARHPGSGARATVSGTVDVDRERGIVLGLAGQWTRFRWPLAATEPAFESPRGRYAIQGTKPWAVRAEGEVIAAGQPAMPAQASGLLSGESFQIEEGMVQVLGGSATVTGEARWKPAESWQVQGHMTGLDPALIRSDLPGRLDFDYIAGGEPFGEAGSIELAVSNATGTLRQQAASGSGTILRASSADDWQFRDVDLRVGRTRIQLDGGLGENRDISFALDADDLSLFDVDARGRISARGRYAGTDDAPLLMFKARGADFEWQDYRLAELDADLDVNLRPGGTARGQIELSGLTIGARTIDKASLALSGDEDQQRVALDVDAAPLRAAILAQGAISDGLWRGQVQSVRVIDAADLSLQLESPASIVASTGQFDLSTLCLMGEQERFCASARMQPGGDWSSEFSTEALPLITLTAGLTQNIHYEGTINLQGRMQGGPGHLPTGSLQSVLTGARIRHVLTNGREERVSLGTGQVTASATETDFSMVVGLDAGDAGGITGNLQGRRTGGSWQDYPVTGRLDARTDALSLLDIYVGDIDKATGRLSTRVDISGTLGEPTIEGVLTLRDAAIDIYQVNLALRDLSFDARFDANALDITGQSRLGENMAEFSGRLAWRDGEPYGNLKLKGERLLIVNVPEARIEASPDLDFRLEGRNIEARGQVRIPVARLEPADLTNAVLVSGDEEMVGAPPVDPAQRWIVVSDINLVLGNDVHIDTLGLSAKLGGTLEVRTDALQNTRGRGELNVASGKYQALGRLLDIERGNLIFNNVPLGDPGLDLRAQKVFPDITAGVNVRGTLRAPRMTFFSEPAVPQSQIASLILAGGSLESVQNSQRAGAARNDLLAQGGAILAQRFGNQVGVDDVGIESNLSNDTSLVLGKYLSDRLYISYGISLAEAINTLKLRYTIGDHWTIKTEAGQERSADIVYTFKKK